MKCLNKVGEMPVPASKGGQRTDKPETVNRGKTPVNTENETVAEKTWVKGTGDL